jgi:hypothetical protein
VQKIFELAATCVLPSLITMKDSFIPS